jgi:hypothetical protein
MIGTTLWEYAAFAAIAFILPLALLACAVVTAGGVSAPLRVVGLALLAAGALVLLRQVLRTGITELMLEFAIPTLIAAAVVYPLAAIALVRSATRQPRRLASAKAAAGLLAAAALVQFAAPWILISGN